MRSYGIYKKTKHLPHSTTRNSKKRPLILRHTPWQAYATKVALNGFPGGVGLTESWRSIAASPLSLQKTAAKKTPPGSVRSAGGEKNNELTTNYEL